MYPAAGYDAYGTAADVGPSMKLSVHRSKTGEQVRGRTKNQKLDRKKGDVKERHVRRICGTGKAVRP